MEILLCAAKRSRSCRASLKSPPRSHLKLRSLLFLCFVLLSKGLDLEPCGYDFLVREIASRPRTKQMIRVRA